MKITELNISICSYNLNWKIMEMPIKKTNSSIDDDKSYKFKINLLKNIKLIYNYYNPFIYCFQEASRPQDIIKIFDPDKFNFNVGQSGPEQILTLWNKQIFRKLLIINSEFEEGRPFTIIVLCDKRFKINFILINIHAAHNVDTLETIFKPIQQTLESDNFIYKKLIEFNITRIIMCGDFNRDINKELILQINAILYLKIGKKKYFFNYRSNDNKTCCSLTGYGYKHNYDNVIDSYNKPLQIYLLNKEKWYQSKSSDHLMILSVVKNFI